MDHLVSKSRLIFDFDSTIGALQIDWTDWHLGIGDIFRFFEPTFDLDRKGEKVHFYQNAFFQKYGKECRDKVTVFSEKYELDNCKGFAGNKKVIEIIRREKGKKMYVWSSNCKKSIERCLNDLDLLNRFEKIVAREDVFYIKPDSEGFTLIADAAPLDQYIFFGDSVFDRDAARNIHVDYIDVKTL